MTTSRASGSLPPDPGTSPVSVTRGTCCFPKRSLGAICARRDLFIYIFFFIPCYVNYFASLAHVIASRPAPAPYSGAHRSGSRHLKFVYIILFYLFYVSYIFLQCLFGI